MRFSVLNILFDLLYISMLCAIVLITFFVAFLPQQSVMATAYIQSVPVLQHTVAPALPLEIAMLCAVASLLYLKCIWTFIRR